jgi:hypothetical protein
MSTGQPSQHTSSYGIWGDDGVAVAPTELTSVRLKANSNSSMMKRGESAVATIDSLCCQLNSKSVVCCG